MSVASRREWDRVDILDTLPRILTVNASRGLGYPSTVEANGATAPQIAAQSPSDNSKTTISDAPIFSGSPARARRSVGSGRTRGGADLTAAGLAFCGKREPAPLPQNKVLLE
jgi:hypothetical protein